MTMVFVSRGDDVGCCSFLVANAAVTDAYKLNT